MRADPIAVDATLVADVKAYLRLDATAEDALVARLAAAALAHGESFTGQIFLARGVSETLSAAADWRRLGATPVIAVGSVSGLSAMGVAVPFAGDAYAIDIDANGDGWVRVNAPGGATRVVVAYQAGLAAGWAALPEPVRQGTVRLAAHLYTHRDAAGEGAPPAAVAALWRPWRRMRLW